MQLLMSSNFLCRPGSLVFKELPASASKLQVQGLKVYATAHCNSQRILRVRLCRLCVISTKSDCEEMSERSGFVLLGVINHGK